jgi:hypothetical protein
MTTWARDVVYYCKDNKTDVEFELYITAELDAEDLPDEIGEENIARSLADIADSSVNQGLIDMGYSESDIEQYIKVNDTQYNEVYESF